MPSVKLRSFGGIDTDSDIQDIRNGNYPDARNIDHIKSSSGESSAITPMIGNTYAADLGEVQPQNKAYLFRFPEQDSGELYGFSLLRSNGLSSMLPSDVTFFSASDFAPGGVVQGFLTSNGVVSQIYPADQLYPTITSPNTWVIVIESSQGSMPSYYDYIIKNTGNKELSISIIREAITETRSGPLRPIGSWDILGDVFILSSPQYRKPEKIKISNINIVAFAITGEIATIDVFFGSPGDTYDLGTQVEIYLTGITQPVALNGTYNATIIQTEIITPTGSYIEYRARIIFLRIPATSIDFSAAHITLNPFGLGEIGVARKNKVTNTWSYTRLLRSKELNWFSFLKKKVRGQVSLDRKSIYFTGAPFGSFYYNDDSAYIEDGAINLFSDTGYYSYGNIFKQIKLQPDRPSFKISLEQQNSSGGSLLSGNIIYFARGVLSDGTPTDWSLPSNEVPVYSANTGVPASIMGDEPGVQTSKSNGIKISNINSELYSYVEIAAAQRLQIGIDFNTYGIFAKIATQPGISELIVTHLGSEIPTTVIQAEFDVQTQIYSSADTLNIIRNRLLLGRLRISDYDIGDFLSNFRYSLEKKEISYNSSSVAVSTYGGSQDPGNVFNYSGYMLNETYRISARVKFTDGSTTDVKKLFDITIDTEPTSADGKRISGLDSYDLTRKVVTGVSPTGIELYEMKDLVPYISIKNIDFDSVLINGVQASSIIESVEFFRAEVSNPTIIGSGYAVMHVECATTELLTATAPVETPPAFRTLLSATQRVSIVYSRIALDTGDPTPTTPNKGIKVVSYEFPFICGSQETQLAYATPYDIDEFLPFFVRYYDDRFTMNSGPLSGLDGGYIWNDRFCSIYTSDNFTSSGLKNIQPGDKIINFGSPARDLQFNSPLSNNPSNFYSRFYTDGLTQKEEVEITELAQVDPETPAYMTDRYVTKGMGQIPRPGQVPAAYIQDVNAVPGAIGPANTFDMFVPLGSFVIIINGTVSTSFNTSLGVAGFINLFNSTNPLGLVAEGDGSNGIYFHAPVNSLFWQSANLKVRTTTFAGVENTSVEFGFSDAASIESQNALSFNPGFVSRLQQTLSGGINNQSPEDYGIRMIQIKRDIPVGVQYPDAQALRYVYTGSSISPGENVSEVDVFGGDTLTTQQIIRHITKTAEDFGTITGGMTQGICITMQTKKNISLCYSVEDGDFYPGSYPLTNSSQTNLLSWLDKQSLDPYNYNEGYSIEIKGVGYLLSYPAAFKEPRKLLSRFVFSDEKPLSAISDYYRRIAPASYKDLDPTDGYLTDLVVHNGELFTLQQKAFYKQYFATGGTMRLEDGAEIVFGDASILQRSGTRVSSFGCSDLFSVLTGKSQGGDDITCYYDRINRKLMRFGADGCVPISDRALFRAGLIKATSWISNTSELDGLEGIHGVWNQLLFEFIWTSVASRYKKGDGITKAWRPLVQYKEGDIVYLDDEINFINFERTTVFYIVTEDHLSTQDTKPGVSVGWELYFDRPEITNTEYYNLNTFHFNEIKNRFTVADAAPHPNIYIPWEDQYLSPRPAEYKSKLFQHNEGQYLKWYDVNGSAQIEEGYIDIVFNVEVNRSKRFISIASNSEVVPFKIEFTTKAHNTRVLASDFTWILDQFFAGIPNQIIGSDTLTDSTELFGQWIKVRFFFEPEQYQKLVNAMVKFNMLPVDYNI